VFDWITNVVQEGGYLAIFLLMLAENVFPPIPSELILPLAGFVAAEGRLDVALVVAASTAGALAGALFWYFVGRWLGIKCLRALAARHGRWLTIAPDDLDSAQEWFARHCGKAVLFGRLIPAVRTVISVPPGIIGMGVSRFLFYSALGTALWSAALVAAGFGLEDQHQNVARWLSPVSNAVVALLVAWYLYRLVTFRSARRRRGADA
jgi:membrane protein DedA with SNARE-associated domain